MVSIPCILITAWSILRVPPMISYRQRTAYTVSASVFKMCGMVREYGGADTVMLPALSAIATMDVAMVSLSRLRVMEYMCI